MTEKLLMNRHENGIVVITFNRPDRLNALDIETMHEFAAIIKSLTVDENLRALILTGAGDRAFCSGGDLQELASHETAEEGRAMITLMGDALLRMERLPVPVIAAINGYALGGGSEIAVACDFRIIDESARLGFVQLKMGVTPGWGAGQRLMRIVGYSRALDLLLTARVLHAPEAESLQLANRIVDTGKALDHALEYASHIAQSPPQVVRGIKALLHAGLWHPYDEALAVERDIFPPLWADEPHLRAVANFLQRQRDKNNS